MSAHTPAHPAPMPASDDLLEVLFNVSMTGVILFRPVFAADEAEIVDLAYVRLNAAAQQMLQLPERPAQSFLALYPHARPTGVFDFYCQAFQSSAVKRHQFNYQHDGLDAYFYLAAQRSGEVLVVNFTDTNDQPRTAVEDALRQAQARERAALAEAEAQRANLARLFQQAPAAICVLAGAELTFELVNPLHQRLFPGRELLGRPLREALPELWDHAGGQILRQVYATGEAHETPEITVPMRRVEEGPVEDIYFHNVTQPRRNAQGQVDGLLLFTFDITEQVVGRRQVEQLNAELEARVQARTQELHAQQALLQRILDGMPAYAATLSGPEHRVSYANAAFQRLLGDRAILGLPNAEAVPEAVGQGLITTLGQVYASGQARVLPEVPLQLPQANGELRQHYINVTYQALPDAQGRPQDVLAFGVDVTEQVLARQQVAAADAELRLLTAHAPAFLFRTDAAGSLVYLNESFFEWTGLDATRLRSLDESWAVVHSGDLAAQQPGFVAAVQAGRPWQSTPYRFRRHDGQYRWMLSRTQPLFGTEGQVLGHTGLTFEVHEQVELQQQLERTNVDLDTFVYTASHDLKAPITNIESITLALRETLPPAVQQDEMVGYLLNLLDQTIIRFQFTIDQLTDLSKLQLAHAGPAEPVALAAVLEGVRLDLAPVIAAAGAQLTVEVAPDLLVSFSPGNLRSILYNLLSNAVKYRDPARPAQVHIRASVAGPRVVVTVQDNGLGLNDHQQQRLFGLFQRLHTHVEGTGVGLYITKRLVENGGGTITVESKVDSGTTFTVTLPT